MMAVCLLLATAALAGCVVVDLRFEPAKRVFSQSALANDAILPGPARPTEQVSQEHVGR